MRIITFSGCFLFFVSRAATRNNMFVDDRGNLRATLQSSYVNPPHMVGAVPVFHNVDLPESSMVRRERRRRVRKPCLLSGEIEVVNLRAKSSMLTRSP
jgi:hypothetical protein